MPASHGRAAAGGVNLSHGDRRRSCRGRYRHALAAHIHSGDAPCNAVAGPHGYRHADGVGYAFPDCDGAAHEHALPVPLLRPAS